MSFTVIVEYEGCSEGVVANRWALGVNMSQGDYRASKGSRTRECPYSLRIWETVDGPPIIHKLYMDERDSVYIDSIKLKVYECD